MNARVGTTDNKDGYFAIVVAMSAEKDDFNFAHDSNLCWLIPCSSNIIEGCTCGDRVMVILDYILI